MSQAGPIELEFSRKYDRKHAQQYFDKHRAGPMRRLSDWREQRIARAALAKAGDPASVLDLPCGAGRFWPMLAERSERRILAADNSADMIAVAQATQAPEIVARVEAFQTSAFAIDLGRRRRGLRVQHAPAAPYRRNPAHRLAMLREFHRVFP